MALFLLRYGEIGIKSPSVRRRLESRLARNLLLMLDARGAQGAVEIEWGHLRLRADDTPSVRDALARCFGLVSASLAVEIAADLPALAREVARLAAPRLRRGDSFAVRVRRTGEHGFTSMDAAATIGQAVREACGDRVRVRLKAPDHRIDVEIRGASAYYCPDAIRGPGGLPVGSQGRAAALVDGPRGALAAWFALRRGCELLAVAPEPHGALALLAAWTPQLRALPGDSLDAAVALAQELGAEAVFAGLDLDEVLALAPTPVPVFAPLAGLTEADVAERLERVRDPRGTRRRHLAPEA